jgi:acid phosphatase family membrane protein YuiD
MDGGSAINAPDASSSSSSTFSYFSVFHNYPLISAVVSFAIAQAIKFLTTWYKENRWDPKLLVGSGGMPSSHSSTVTALATAIGFYEGFDSSLFATAAVLACVVMYDAFGVRLHAGKQAEVLNQIVYELPTEHPLAETRPLKELLGHTPSQVFAGSVLGFMIATTGQIILRGVIPV